MKFGRPANGDARHRRPAWREVRPRRERQADRRPVPEQPARRRGRSRSCVHRSAAPTARRWDDYEAAKGTSPTPLPEPRRDLRLEALADVLVGRPSRFTRTATGRTKSSCCLRVADRFGVKVKSLQHVLEGYKVAPEIAAHGASVSLFADWWAYKIEAFDAIPYAGPKLLKDAGVSGVPQVRRQRADAAPEPGSREAGEVLRVHPGRGACKRSR